MVRTEVIDKFAVLITGAFGLVAALAWNSAIQGAFQKYYSAGNGLIPLFTYAILVTIIAVLMTLWIGKLSEKAKTPISFKSKLSSKA